MSSLPSPSDKYLKSELEPQRDGSEGTVDRLNEAPRCPECGSQAYFLVRRITLPSYWICKDCDLVANA